MGYHKKTVVSFLTCALLIPSFLTPYVTASYPPHHAHLNQTDGEVGDEDLQGNFTGYMSEVIHVPEAVAHHGASSTSEQDGTPANHSEVDNFDLVDLNRLFPEGHIPSNSSNIQYGLITLGAGSKSGAVDTASSGSGYLLAVGESHGLAQLQKRDGQPDPFVFLDCPANVSDQPVNQTQKARVVCTSEDVDGCFRVRERGVEGTLVEMPEECAPNSFARAISLELAEDQTMPDHLAKQHTPTSPIYEFSFDFNKHKGRTDAKVAIRMDMTNIKGYWDSLVDSPNVEKRDVEPRYFSRLYKDWKKGLRTGDRFKHDSSQSPITVKSDLSTPVFWQAAENCPIGGKVYGEGIAAFVEGNVDANISYAVTVVATGDRGTTRVDVKEATGWIGVTGETDLTFGVGGMGRLDIGMAGKGNPARSQKFYDTFHTQRISAGSFWGFMALTPFISRQTWLSTSRMNESPSTVFGHPAILNGHFATRVKTDLGHFPASFPEPLLPNEIEHFRKQHKVTEVQVSGGNYLYGDGGEKGSTIQIGHDLGFGLIMDFEVYPEVQGQQPVLQPQESTLLVTSETYSSWNIPRAENHRNCPHSSASSLLKQEVVGKDFLSWKNKNGSATLFHDYYTPSHEACNYSPKTKRTSLELPSPGNQSSAVSTNNLNKRGLDNPKDVFGSARLRPTDIFGTVVAYLFTRRSADNQMLGNISCDGGRCGYCLGANGTDPCCGCVCMQCEWGPRSDIEHCERCTNEGDWSEEPWPGSPVKRDRISGNDVTEHEGEAGGHDLKNDLHSRAPYINVAWKDVKVCKELYHIPNPRSASAPFKYPQFPKNANKVWDGAMGGVYDPISSYWGNSTADCADWSIGRNDTRDKTHHPTRGLIPSAYQTEHVYEGQNLGQFFTEWLTKGKIRRQRPFPGRTRGKVDCTWIEEYITSIDGTNFPWFNPSNLWQPYSLLGTLWTELGNIYHQDRLAILQERLNRKKENLFALAKSYKPSLYPYMTTDEQWATVKEIGLTFSYMNNDTIWGMWCDSYKGVYDRLDQFDKWYAVHKSANDPDVTLAEEWGKYNRVVLDSAVRIYRDGWDWTFQKRRTNNAAQRFSPEEAQWQAIRARNPKASVFHLKKSCPNLPPTTIV
ncbi:hypothetical protein H9Q72_007164 [Fusarium xylarioides]|uniref:Uncharacterized protein n=1 Tax=Fusarium xylarioides TaxID=221167 RepID=A0A9P7HS15_9HYPO|nr:hypothetical protein H9Q72_007164 [Fusarium xylarioides]